MSQQINLINPALIEKKNFFSAVNILWSYGLFCLLMLGWYFYVKNDIAQLKAQHNLTVTELTQVQENLAQLTALRMPRQPDAALLIRLKALEDKSRMQLQILEAIKQGKPSQDKGLADYMRGLARQSMENIWLTGFSIHHSEQSMTLRGRTFNTDLLPNYVDQLGHEPVFFGQMFGGLQIKQQESNSSSNADPKQANATVIPYVEFELQGYANTAEPPLIEQASQEASKASKALKS